MTEIEVTKVILASRPGPDKAPKEDNFAVKTSKINFLENESQVLVKSLYLSVDPALRCRMNEDTGVTYLTPWQLNEVIEGLGGIGVIEKMPKNTEINFKVGDIVTSKSMQWPWQTHFLANPDDLELVPKNMKDNLPVVFSCLGLIGLTVLLGIRKKGGLQSCKPQEG